MSASIPIPFELNKECWWIGRGQRERYVTCPECVGTKVITMIKGNGETVSLACEHCSRGFEGPHGIVKETYFEHRPVVFVPTTVDVRENEFHYSGADPDSMYRAYVDAKHLFHDRAECEERCAELNALHTKNAREQDLRNAIHNRKKMASSASYWAREIKELERKLVFYRERLDQARVREAEKKAREKATEKVVAPEGGEL